MSEQTAQTTEGLSRIDKMKAPVYDIARQVVLNGESPYEEALPIKAGEAAMVVGKNILSKGERIKSAAYHVGAEVTLMGESYDGFALAEKTVEAAAVIGRKIYERYRNRTLRPFRRPKASTA